MHQYQHARAVTAGAVVIMRGLNIEMLMCTRLLHFSPAQVTQMLE
jgi:hypothetical protein